MDYGFVGAVTVKETVGPAVVEVVLLDTTPLESTPIIVNEYVLAGVIPFGVVVEGVLLPHPGIRIKAALNKSSVQRAHALLARLPRTLPAATNPNRGNDSHKPYNIGECVTAPVVTGPKVLIVSCALAGVPVTGKLGTPVG